MQIYSFHTCIKPTSICSLVDLLSTTSEERLGCSVFLQLLFFITSCILQPASEHRKERLGERLNFSFCPCSYVQQITICPILSVLVHRTFIVNVKPGLNVKPMLNLKLRFCKPFQWSPVCAVFTPGVKKTILVVRSC